MATVIAPTTKKRKPRESPWAYPPPLPLRLFTVEQYHKLLNFGILREAERTELIEGWLVQKMTLNPPHAYAVGELSQQIIRILSADWVCRTQMPVTFPTSEPEPDVAVVRGPNRRYARNHPKAKD